MFSQLAMFQNLHKPASTKDAETHHVPHVRMPMGGRMVVAGEHDARLVEAYAADVAASVASRQRLTLYERLSPAFRFFVHVACGSDNVVCTALALFGACGAALRTDDCGENVFFPDMNVAQLRSVVLHNGTTLRLVFPDVIVDAERALQIHRYVVDCFDHRLDVEVKRRVLPRATTAKALSVPHGDRWREACPASVYIEPSGVAMYGGMDVCKCEAGEGRGRAAHDDCAACDRCGYVVAGGRWELCCAVRDARAPRVDEEETAALRADVARCVRAASVRADGAPLSERYVVPSYAPAVMLETRKGGKREFVTHFDAERPTYVAKKQNRVELDLHSNDFRVVSTVASMVHAVRRMHPQYARVGVAKVYRYHGSGAKPTYRVLADGQNATYCMSARRHARCRASFLFEEVGGRGKVCMECCAPECGPAGGKRYRSKAIDLPHGLNELLGFASRSDASGTEDAMLSESAILAFEKLRNIQRRDRRGPRRGR